MRYVNQHLRSCKFQYEDIRTAANLFKKGDWFFEFDYASGYHHIEIVVEHTKFLGCSLWVNGIQKFFKFTVLPFGLATGVGKAISIQPYRVTGHVGGGVATRGTDRRDLCEILARTRANNILSMASKQLEEITVKIRLLNFTLKKTDAILETNDEQVASRQKGQITKIILAVSDLKQTDRGTEIR